MIATITTSGRLEDVVAFQRWSLGYKDVNVNAISPRLDTHHPDLEGVSYITFTGTVDGVQHVITQATAKATLLEIHIEVKTTPEVGDEEASATVSPSTIASETVRSIIAELTKADGKLLDKATASYLRYRDPAKTLGRALGERLDGIRDDVKTFAASVPPASTTRPWSDVTDKPKSD